MGIKLVKMWSATMDDRTRDSHAFLDGVTVPLEQEFPNGLMYPGDPGGSAEEVWNCRCELSMQMEGFERDRAELFDSNAEHFGYDSYEDWKNDRKPLAKWIGAGLSKDSWYELPADRKLWYLNIVSRHHENIVGLKKSEKLRRLEYYGVELSKKEYAIVTHAMNEKYAAGQLENNDIVFEPIGDYLYNIFVAEFGDYVVLGRTEIK